VFFSDRFKTELGEAELVESEINLNNCVTKLKLII